LPEVLATLYNHCGGGFSQPSIDNLQDTLQMILYGFNSAFIVLDALDECTERAKLLNWVQTVIVQKNKNLQLHLIVTSRPEKEINDRFHLLDNCCVDMVMESGGYDLVAYLDYQLENNPELRRWDQKTREEVKSILIEQADGMYVFNM
jgi:hypothetical protein